MEWGELVLKWKISDSWISSEDVELFKKMEDELFGNQKVKFRVKVFVTLKFLAKKKLKLIKSKKKPYWRKLSSFQPTAKFQAGHYRQVQ